MIGACLLTIPGRGTLMHRNRLGLVGGDLLKLPKRKAVIMKLKHVLLSLVICVLAAGPARAVTTYTVNCPPSPQYTLFVLQVYDSANSAPLAGGEDLNTVLQNFNSGGALDGCLLYQFTTVIGSTPTITIYTVDSSQPTGWANATDTAGVPPPKMHLGDGAIFVNNTGSAGTLTFNGNVLSPEPPVTVAANTWYLHGRQVPSTVSCATTAASWQDMMQNGPPGFSESVYVWNGGPFNLPWINSASYNVYTWNGSVWTPTTPGFCLGIGQPAVFIGPSSTGTTSNLSATISGNVYLATNCFATNQPLQNWSVAATATSGGGKYYGISDASGNYSIQVPAPGNYSVNSYLPPIQWHQACPSGPYLILASAGGFYPGNDFREFSTVIGRDLAVDLVSFFPYPLRSPCCGQNMTYVITARNAGTVGSFPVRH